MTHNNKSFNELCFVEVGTYCHFINQFIDSAVCNNTYEAAMLLIRHAFCPL